MFLRKAQLTATFSLLLAGCAVAFAQASEVVEQEADVVITLSDSTIERPYFVEGSIHPTGQSSVFGVAQTPVTDVVIINNGLDQGFRLGMICRVARAGTGVADLILVDVRDNRAAGLILNLESGQAIRSGDAVKIKTINL